MVGTHRRDRHGRGMRGVLLSADTPRHASRSASFDADVIDAYAPLVQRFPTQLSSVDVAVDVVPRMALSPNQSFYSDEIVADGPVPLARLIPAAIGRAGRPTRTRIVVFRQPIESRCATRSQRHGLIRYALVHLVAGLLNMTADMIDPDIESHRP